MNTTSKFTLRAALALLVMMLTTATAWAGTVDVTVNVTGSGSVSIGNQTATEGNPFTTSVDDGASVTLTIAPDAGNIVTSAKLSYKPSEDGTAVDDIAISGSTATFQMPNDIWNGTGVTINVTFGAGLVGGADEASAVALTDATVSNLAGGYYKVESDISFDHTLNLIGNTYLVIASGAKMTVSSSEYGINGELYALNVLGEGTLNVTTTGSYKIAVCVSSYTQSGCSVNLTTSFMGMRCSDSFNISGGSFKTNGSEGIWPDNAVNISGGKLEASNIDANINLSYSNTDDYIKVDNYTSGKTMTIANGQTFTDGTTNYSGTITNLSPLNGKKLFPFVYMHLTVRDATCTEVGIKQECWQRSSDGKYFSDENGTNELNASDVEIPMIAHNGIPHEATDTHIAYWQCSVCSKYFSNSGCTTEITEEDTKIYRTITIDDGIRDYVTSNVDKAVAGTTVTLTVSHLINASTLQVNGGSVTLTDAGNGTYTFTVPAADVTVTASTATTYSVNLPANMEIVSATTTADGDGKYISGTVVTFKASFSYTASNVSDGANTLTADGSGNYSVTVGTADITVTATIGHSSNIDLSQAPSDFTVVDGDVLTGSTSHTVTIANNAKITLSNATISGGIVCDGTAEITLVGTNSVSNTWYSSAGIQIGGSGTTLTIKGDGSLTATGGSQAAGIGLGRTWDANATGGSVVIEGGTVTASGGNGIGTGTVGNSMTAHMDGIIIKGGTVNARLGKGTINNGSSVTIGTIKIYDGIEKVDASTITESVTYMHVENETETDVTATASTYFTIIEDGDRRVITQKDDTDYTITIADNLDHGTIAYAATTAKYGEKITITATPDFGYRLSRLVVKDTQNNSVASTGNSFFMPKSNVTVSAVFEQGVHGTTEFAWSHYDGQGLVTDATIYDGVTTVNLQQERSYSIIKYSGYSYSKFLLDNDTYNVNIPYAGGTGAFVQNRTSFNNNGDAGFYDITMTDVGNGKWSVSILKTVGQMDVVPDQTYTGSEIKPEPLVMAGSLNLTKGTDYEYSYTNNTNVGTATVTVTFQGDYASIGSVEKEFTIVWSETDTDEYTIHNAAEWNVFCDCLDDNDTYNRFSGKTVRLGDDITVTRMAGSGDNPFCGNFDGGGNTLTFTATAADNYCAPFVGVKGGTTADDATTISNLNVVTTITANDYRHMAGLIALQWGHVNVSGCNATVNISSTVGTSNPHDLYPAALVSQASSSDGGTLTVTGCTASGTISTDGKYAAGLVGIVQGTASISDCISSVTINSSTSGDGTHGGIVAALSGVTNIYGTVFNGRLLGEDTESVGGFIGWRNKGANIYNSLFIPTEVTVKKANSATFARNKVDTYNSYYTYYLCDGTNYAPYDPADADHPDKYNNGHATRTVTAGTDVTIDAIALTGTATQYTVSGITAYSGGGLQRGETLYYGSDDQLSLTLSSTGAPLGYRYDGYTASAGTLSGTTLTMPDEDVTISVNTAALAPIDWATVNQGTSADPYMIYNKDQLLLLAHRVNGTNGETANTYQGKYFKLGADITFDHDADEGDDYAENYEAIGTYSGGTDRYFCGQFDGDGHTVSGIRIRKTTGSSDYQGLFGLIDSGADIHDVHLTDARIKGYNSVGGIVGYNYGTVSGCSVTDSYITATGDYYGTICGFTTITDHLSQNYYHGCTVNGTAVTSGKGCQGADIADYKGALPAYHLTLGANITPPRGTFAGQTVWLDTPPVSPRLAPENGFTLAGNHYFASGYVFTPGSTLASGAAQGYTPRATLGDVLLDLYTPTGDNDPLAGKAIARLTITADCDGKTLSAALRSDGQQHDVSYTEADGTTQTAKAIALDGHETVNEDGDVCLDEGTYYVGTDITYANRIWLNGDIILILVDGKTMTLNGKKQGIFNVSNNLTIYGQSLDDDAGTLRYDGTSYGIHVNNYEQHSGNVSITTTGFWVRGIAASDVTLRGGTLTVTADGDDACAIYGRTHSILGGQLTATATGTGTEVTGILAHASSGTAITLGWTRPADRITASSISAPNGGTVAVKDGQALTDGSGHIYTGTLSASVLSGFAAETTLQPCLALADAADNTAAITDHAGQTLAVALSGRTLYKDGSWNTLCLPFAVDLTDSGTLSGDNVQAMTLNTTTSSFADGTLTLNFTAAETIPAGTPFIIKWDESGSDIKNPVFMDVTVSNATNDATVTGVLTFTGTYAPKDIGEDGDNTLLYLGAANKLYWPNAAMTIGTHRAYFQLQGGLTAGEPASGVEQGAGEDVRAFVLNFGNAGDPARIIPAVTAGEGARAPHAWYTLDGRKLDGTPTQKGIYVNNGRKVIIK